MTSLFAWQRAVLSSSLPAEVQRTALRIGLDSTQMTGQDVVINDAQVAADLGCSERTVWRRVQALLAGEWLVQTVRPTYAGADSRGRRARYGLTVPGGSSDSTGGTVTDDDTPSSDTSSCGESDDTTESSDTSTGTTAHDAPSRLPNPAQSSATTTPDDVTLSASDGSRSSSGDVAIDILAGKLRRYTILSTLRTDKLKPHQAAELRALIDLHGDQKLVDHAMRTVRRDDPPQTIQAFLPGWRVIPKPGDRSLAAVPDLCPEHGHTDPAGACCQCASEALATPKENR